MSSPVRKLSDEFALLPELAAVVGIPPHTTPTVTRRFINTPAGVRISGVSWSTQAAEVVLVHRDGTDARSLDRIALSLGLPALAIDLPGHGESGGVPVSAGESGRLLADAVATLAPQASAIIGLGSGALSSLVSYEVRRPRIDTIVLVDCIPGADATLWGQLTRTASSYVIRTRESPVSRADIGRLRQHAPNTRLLQLPIKAADVETTGAVALANALRAVLGVTGGRW